MARIAIILALLLAVSIAGCIGQQPETAQPLSQQPAPAFILPIEQRLGELSNSVLLIAVNVTVLNVSYTAFGYNPYTDQFYASGPGELSYEYKGFWWSGGSGFVVSEDSHILTNAHVVYTTRDEIVDFEVETYREWIYRGYSESDALHRKERIRDYLKQHLVVNRAEFAFYVSGKALPGPVEAELIRYGTPGGAEDVALLKARPLGIEPLALGDSDNLTIGERLYVIGYPGAALINITIVEEELNPTVTSGVVSAVRKTPEGNKIIQTDTLVSGGNSGGPALNAKGEVVGIATLGTVYGNFIPTGYNYLVTINYAKEFSRPESLYWTTTGQLIAEYGIDRAVLIAFLIVALAYFYLERPSRRKH